MADIQINTKAIQAGEPVTADLINQIVKDLNSLNQAATAANIVISNSNDKPAPAVSSKVYSKQAKVSINIKNNPSGKVTWTFKDDGITFSKAPACWIQASINGATMSEAQMRIHAYVYSVSTTAVTFHIKSGAGAANASINFNLFAAEVL